MRLAISLVFLAALVLAPRAEAAEPRPDISRIFSLLQDDLEAPAAWAGIWDIELVTKDCTTGFVFSTLSELDTLCTGSPVDISDDEEIDYVCTGSVTDNSISAECTASTEIIEGCTATFTINLTATRTGDSYEGSTVVNTDYEGINCGPFTDSCIQVDVTGTRIAPQPASCTTPVESVRWGTIKARYN